MASLQLDLFAEPPVPPVLPVERETDPLVEQLVAGGLAPNEYLLNMNRALYCPPAMDLPSRLFQWPVEFVDRSRREDGKSALLLNHPAFDGMPFVDEIEARCGVRPIWEDRDEFGRERISRYQYFHAMDLLTDEHWSDMLRTRHFCSEKAITNGLCYRATYGGLSTDNMRSVLAAINAAEPSDQSSAYLASDAVRVTEALQGIFVGLTDWSSVDAVWATVHGLESKKLKRDKSGHLRFSPAFLAEKSPERTTT